MKLSNYNIVTRKKLNMFIFHNMISKATVVLTKKELSQFNNFKLNLNDTLNMKELGFYIDDNIDEVRNILNENKSVCDDLKTLNITLIPTFACNLSCTYCYQNGLDFDVITDENIETFISFVMNRLKETEAENFHLSWFGGEPLLVFDKIKYINEKLIQYCNQNNIKFSSSIATNLTVFRPEMLKLMIDLHIERIETTLAGTSKYHNLLRIPRQHDIDSYKSTIEGIKLVSNKIVTMININFCKENFKSIKILLKNLKRIKNNNIYLNFNEIVNYEQNRKQVKQLKDIEKFKIKMFNYALKLNFKICDTTNFCKEAIYCPQWHKNSFAIDNKLNVYKCTELFDEETRIGYIDLYTNRLILQKEINACIDNNCKKCNYLPYCNGGCIMKKIQKQSPCPSELSSVSKYLKLFVKRMERAD